MHRVLWLFLLLTPASAESRQDAQSPQAMRCETGPITKTFGGTEWIVYSCDDEVSLVVVSAQGNPAFPFFFYLQRKAESYQVVGEGNGDKRASEAAGRVLSELSSAEIAALLAATKTAASRRKNREWGNRVPSPQ